MRAWAWMMGGLLVWMVHFLGVYSLASLADVVSTADALVWRGVTLAFSLVCILATAALLWLAIRRLQTPLDDTRRFQQHLAASVAGISLLAISWQTLPVFIGH